MWRAEAAVAEQPAETERRQARRDEDERLRADPDAERGHRPRREREPALGAAVQQPEDQADEEDEEEQQKGVVVGAPEARVGDHGRLHQQRQAGEQTGVALEHGCRRPA